MQYSYVFSARNVDAKGHFGSEPGPVRFLKVPLAFRGGKLAAGWTPKHEIERDVWMTEVADLADGMSDVVSGKPGHVLVFVHGYNNDIAIVHKRSVQLQFDLAAEQFSGTVVAFDWPSADSTLNYLEDRSDAAKVAIQLVEHGIVPLAARQERGCEVNVHLLGHSTGAYVIMEAFENASKRAYGSGDARRALFKSDWRVGQIALIGGDVSADSLAADSAWAQPMYGRCMRLTNYANPFDDVLAISNAKRLGVAPRAGRVGLPKQAHSKSVNVDCGPFFEKLDPKRQPAFGTFCHSWHIGNRVFARDLAMTLEGRIDRDVIPTRAFDSHRGLVLREAARPPREAAWQSERDDDVRR